MIELTFRGSLSILQLTVKAFRKIFHSFYAINRLGAQCIIQVVHMDNLYPNLLGQRWSGCVDVVFTLLHKSGRSWLLLAWYRVKDSLYRNICGGGGGGVGDVEYALITCTSRSALYINAHSGSASLMQQW
ncbi:hypothetical protein LOAG_03429 [Loa loa]|uniref:Uncharacterized protein n=1 Tax=Loa loa TaxID=7209 RepID=A0A1S0U4H6_LOALO|nr:hypothetical protein LOAG_03429 [Loa loa]EFO25048.1 hypothetical protein LOAG_03429 [Loa loa]